MNYKLTGFFLFVLLLTGYQFDSAKGPTKQIHRKIISYTSYDDYTSGNSIFIQLPDSAKTDLNCVRVRLTHGIGCTPMHNFIVSIGTDNDGYDVLKDNFRFLESEFDSKNDTIIEKDIYLNSCQFHSHKKNTDVSYSEVKDSMFSSKRISILATMSDMALLENPLSSSSLRRSNMIEIIYE